MRQSGVSVLVLVAVVFQCFSVDGVLLEVRPNKERCIYDEFRPDTLVTGKVKASPAYHDMQLYLKIADHEGQPVYENKQVLEATFAFTSQSESEYSFCFLDSYSGADVRPVRLVDIEIDHNNKEKDYEEVAKRENLKPIELEIRKIEDAVEALKNDFTYMKNREAKHRNTNESTNSRVVWMSFLSVGILVGLGFFQMYYLKKYFKSKKLI